MELIKVVCPSCGGTLNIEPKSEFVFCNFCGNKFSIPKVSTNQPNIDNYMKLADSSVGTSTNEKAIDYYNKVLEIEPENYKAKIGVAFAAYFTSSLMSPHLLEMSVRFKDAYKTVPAKEKEAISTEIKSYTLTACRNFHSMALSHYKEFKGQVNDVQDEFHRWSVMVIMTIDSILSIKEGDKGISKALAEYGIYVLGQNNYFKPSYVREKVAEYQNYIQGIDPNYVAPTVPTGFCFIATATMGDYNHPYVITLRKFRDNYLQKSYFGEKFIKLYYRTSPPFAGLISKSNMLRKISLRLIVKPLTKMVDRYMSK